MIPLGTFLLYVFLSIVALVLAFIFMSGSAIRKAVGGLTGMRLIGYLCLWVGIFVVATFLLGGRVVKIAPFLGIAFLIVIGSVSLGLLYLKGHQKLAFILLLIALAVVLLRLIK